MLFNSVDFIFYFLPISLLVFFAFASFSWTWARLAVCAASLVFYAWWNPAFLIILVVSILFNYLISVGIEQAPGRWKGTVLTLGVIGDLGALAYYKYALWLIGMAFGHDYAHALLGTVALPLGISFFTFTQIGYLIDVHEGTAKERNFLNYVLFVTFFPHLIAGPILHHKEVMPQFADHTNARFSVRHFAIGVTVFFAGLFKKTFIADGLQPIVAAGYGQSGHIGVAAAWLTMVAYSAQLYFDFSGYSDMATGVARMFNIKFPINFNSPYKAPNVAEFWQRWHMTLTRYLNAYLYNPVAVAMTRKIMVAKPGVKNPLGTPGGFALSVALPTFWTMTLAGIWHGAGAQFLVFGLMHSSFITISRLWQMYGPAQKKLKKGQKPDTTYRLRFAAAVLLTLACTTTANLFFRAPDLATAVAMLKGAYGLHGLGMMPAARDAGFDGLWQELLAVTAAFVLIWGAPNLYEVLGDDSPVIGKVASIKSGLWHWRLTPLRAALVGAMGVAGILMMGKSTEFIYFQF